MREGPSAKARKRTKVIEIRDVTMGEAVRLIEGYMREHPGRHYVSDIAEEVGIELKVAFAAAQRLIDRGNARVAEESPRRSSKVPRPPLPAAGSRRPASRA